ncbi:MAG: hypothetical protein ACRD68_06910 [Pyrinomonadaceae bacterium]
MNLFLRITLASLLLATGTLPAVAQKRFCPAAPPSPFKHNATIVTNFDRASDRMRTTLEHPRPLDRRDGEIYLSASFVHRDSRKPVDNAGVDITFISRSVIPRYRDSHDIVILADAGQWPFAGNAAHYRRAQDGNGAVLESTRVTIPHDVLLNIIRSKRVAARLGQTEFELTHNHLEALRELASLAAPPKTDWGTR